MTRATDTAARPPTRFAAGAGAARLAIRERRNWIQLLQFCLVGASGYLVNVAVYALLVRVEQRGLVDVEKVPSEKGPPRKVYTLNAQGEDYLTEFWRTWSFLAERLEQLRPARLVNEEGEK